MTENTNIDALQAGGTQVSRDIKEHLEELHRQISARWASEDAIKRVEALERLVHERCPPKNRNGNAERKR